MRSGEVKWGNMREEKRRKETRESYNGWEFPQMNEKRNSRVKKIYVPQVEYIQIKPEIAKNQRQRECLNFKSMWDLHVCIWRCFEAWWVFKK